MDPGVYLLLLFGNGENMKIGALGTLPFETGYYIYVGSALGPDGLARVSRHIRLFHDRNRKPRWHIDYLLLHPGFSLLRAYCLTTTRRVECMVAAGLQFNYVPRVWMFRLYVPITSFYIQNRS